MRNGVSNKRVKALAMAMTGATLAAVSTMFVPVAMLESVIGSTGISELVPAAAAPLGDTARAIMAFTVGALTLAVLGYLLPRQTGAPRQAISAFVSFDEPRSAPSLQERLAGIAWPKMPWAKDENDITELSDLPKLRNGDIHPDAPPRRPLWANQDLPVLERDEGAAPRVEDRVLEPLEELVMPPVDAEPLDVFSPAPIGVADVQPTLAEMVAQLEAAVADRQKQLAQLEAVAAQLVAGPVAVKADSAEAPETEILAPEPVRTERPQLEAVPASAQDDDMDSALAAALATLHRMNGTAR